MSNIPESGFNVTYSSLIPPLINLMRSNKTQFHDTFDIDITDIDLVSSLTAAIDRPRNVSRRDQKVYLPSNTNFWIVQLIHDHRGKTQ